MSRSRRKTRKSTQRSGCIGAIVILIIAGAAITMVVMIVNLFGRSFGDPPQNVLVPNLRNMTLEEASARLADDELRLEQGKPVFSDDIEISRIVTHSPPPNRLVKEGRKVTVYISKGKNTYLVPDLVGMKLSRAQERLRETNLYLGRVEKIINPFLDEGVVVSQHPEPGVKMPAAEPVDLVVSVKRTNEKVEMPELVNKMLASAEGLLLQKNLRLVKVKYKPHPGLEYGMIVSQSPPTGRRVPLGTKVTIEVAVDLPTYIALVHKLRVRIKVPKGRDSQEVRVVVDDRLGKNDVYRQRHRVGEIIDQEITVEGSATIRIYFDGELAREDVIG